MKHAVAELDSYPDSWWCSCGEVFRAPDDSAICPNDPQPPKPKPKPKWPSHSETSPM